MNKNKGMLLILGTALISGFAVFLGKFGVSVINPYIFTGLKNIIVALLAVSWLLMMKDWRVLKNLSKKQWFLLSMVGLVGGSIPFLLFFKGLSLTAPAQAAFIHKTMFIYVALLAAIFLKEKISRGYLVAGIGLILGNILLLRLVPHQFGLGDLLVFVATLFWAGENIISKHLLKGLPSRIVIWGRMFFGSILIILFWVLTCLAGRQAGQANLVLSLNLEQIGWVLITSVFLFGYVTTWYTGLKYVKVSVAATILLLASPITTLLTFVFLGGSLALNQSAGIILIVLALGGIYWQYYYGKEKSVQPI